MPLARRLLGATLAAGAKVLSAASKVLAATAETLQPDTGDTRDAAVTTDPIGTEAVISDVVDDAPERGRAVAPPDTPILDETPHLRTSATHIEELAAKSAAEVIAAVQELSTDELRLLTEYEMDHKNRRTVLSAIEKALVAN